MTAICQRSGVLLLCGSMKPPPGDDTPSAARELLRIVHEELRGKVSRTEWMDLRDLNPPMFDGRPLTAIDRPELEAASERIASTSVIVLCPYRMAPSACRDGHRQAAVPDNLGEEHTGTRTVIAPRLPSGESR
jgi:hypothetical protein